MKNNEIKDYCKELITNIVATSPENTLNAFNEPSWEEPIVGFASANDELFTKYKELIGDFYWTPVEAMKLRYPDAEFESEELSVVVWVLPQTEKTILDQRKATKLPSSRWVHSRHYGEFFNEYLRRTVENSLCDNGIMAVAPAVLDDFAYQKSDKFGLCSNWSERHTAYTAGLGTFSLSDGFITEKGKAVRIGSVVLNAKIEPTFRKAKHHYANCLYYAKGTCGACIKRCPINAISNNGHDKQVCHDYIRGVTAPYAKELLGAMQTPCGLCQVKIPCERRNPMNI